jgi:hypothetical protein
LKENNGATEETLTTNASAKTDEIVNASADAIRTKTEEKKKAPSASTNALVIGAGVCLLSGLLY